MKGQIFIEPPKSPRQSSESSSLNCPRIATLAYFPMVVERSLANQVAERFILCCGQLPCAEQNDDVFTSFGARRTRCDTTLKLRTTRAPDWLGTTQTPAATPWRTVLGRS